MPDDYRYTDPATTRLPPAGTGYQPRVSGWVEDPSEPTGWRWVRDHTPSGSVTHILPTVEGPKPWDPGDTYLMPAVAGRVEYAGHVDYAQVDDSYVYTDPTTDDAWPRIAEHDDDEPPDAFPSGWSGEPTERDQAAIDAGNA